MPLIVNMEVFLDDPAHAGLDASPGRRTVFPDQDARLIQRNLFNARQVKQFLQEAIIGHRHFEPAMKLSISFYDFIPKVEHSYVGSVIYGLGHDSLFRTRFRLIIFKAVMAKDKSNHNAESNDEDEEEKEIGNFVLL
jgi:hypothetical protein